MFKSKIASLIDNAVQDCITFGSGKARHYDNGTAIDVEAVWAESETEIEITIFENCAIRFSFTEEVPEQFR